MGPTLKWKYRHTSPSQARLRLTALNMYVCILCTSSTLNVFAFGCSGNTRWQVYPDTTQGVYHIYTHTPHQNYHANIPSTCEQGWRGLVCEHAFMCIGSPLSSFTLVVFYNFRCICPSVALLQFIEHHPPINTSKQTPPVMTTLRVMNYFTVYYLMLQFISIKFIWVGWCIQKLWRNWFHKNRPS